MRRLGVAFVAAVILAACGGDDGAEGTGAADGAATLVVASFYPLAEVARRVGGSAVDVVDLTPPGAEPHDLELNSSQVEAIEDAQLVVVLGRGFQPAVEEVAARRDGATIVVLDELGLEPGTVEDEHGGEDEHAGEDAGAAEGEVIDPHVWLDPTKMAEIVDTVADALAAIEPDRAHAFGANADALRADLDELDAEFEVGLADCRRRVIVTSHDAFGWLAARYDLRQEAIAGLEPDQEPSADRLARLADLAREEGLTTIFTETLVSPEVAETLAREAGGIETAVLDPIEGLSPERSSQGDDYFTVMRENLDALRRALGCA